jgi:tetratricopeptide (TPR) repeat protein
VLAQAVEGARAAGDETTAAEGVVALAFLRLHTDPASSHARVRDEIEPAIAVFERTGNQAGLARAWTLAGMLRLWRGNVAEAFVELERAARHAREAGDRVQELDTLASVVMTLLVGQTPTAAALEAIDEIALRADGAPRLELAIALARAELLAAQGEVDAARAHLEGAQRLARERGVTLSVSSLRVAGEVELIAGDLSAAEARFRAFCQTLEERGDWGHYVTALPFLVDALHAQGRGGELAEAIEAAERMVIDDDLDGQIGLRRVHARLRADEGDLGDAKRLGREAVELAAQSDYLAVHAQSLVDLAYVLEKAGDLDGAMRALEDACTLYDRKGHSVGAARARERIATLRPQAV